MATTTKNGRYHATITSKFIHFIDNAINRSQWALQLCVPTFLLHCVCVYLPCTTATVCGLLYVCLCVSVCAVLYGNFFVAYFGLAHIFHVCIFHFNFISSRYTQHPLAPCVCVCVFTCTVKYAMKINKNAHPAEHTHTQNARE